MPFTSHYEHTYSAQHLAVAMALHAWPQQAAGPGNSRTLGLSGRLANRHSDTKLARAGPAGAE